jgi:hypothetical protein
LRCFELKKEASVIIDEDDYIAHYGTPRHSGRYPWGSSGNVANSKDFLGMVEDLKRKGLSDPEICRGLGIGTVDKDGNFRPSTGQLRALKSIAKNEQKQADISQAEKLRATGMSTMAIGREMKRNESSIRALLEPGARDKADTLTSTANMLKDQVAQKKYLDVGAGIETQTNVSATMLNNAVAVLKAEGYSVHTLPVTQVGTGKDTKMRILVGPETTFGELSRNRDHIKQIAAFSEDGGLSYLGLHPPIAVNPKRIKVRYHEEGGSEADGVIYVREGVPDLSLGKARYSQVRIQVGDGHYLKGMAMYKDDLPDGVDLVFNTSKSDTGNKLDAMKELKRIKETGEVDMDNPFGATISSQIGFRRSDPDRIIRQLVVRTPDGTEKVTSAMNIVNSEGTWEKWNRSLPAQFLSKQSPSLAKAQLDKTYQARVKDLDEIMSLTNATVRRKLLRDFGDRADSAAVHLQAAYLPRQASHVILPVASMKEHEVYAPNYENGERVVLVRFPHGGKFEIPDLIVNNRQPEAKKLLGLARDAVGIHPSVAERLSGADFDGDSVLVIPNNTGKVKVLPSLEGLKDFNPRRMYPGYEGMPKLKADRKQQLMGDVTNLITDMSIKQAPPSEIAQAVRHSMVVIDAENHNLNYKLSAIDNGIAALKEKYQGKKNAGAATLISRAKSPVYLPEMKERTAPKGGPIDRETGRREYEPSNRSRINKAGDVVIKTEARPRMSLTDDATTLLSGDGVGTPIERVYAEHANKLKTLANKARKESVNTPRAPYSASARNTYANQVKTLSAKLALINTNRPLERQAQVLANAVIKQKQRDNPDMDRDAKKKVGHQALAAMRNRTGAGKKKIIIENDEWEAIQAGAISDSKLEKILNNADLDVVRSHATPRTKRLMTPSNTAKAKRLLASGATRAEVASLLGVSLSTLDLATVSEEGV